MKTMNCYEYKTVAEYLFDLIEQQNYSKFLTELSDNLGEEITIFDLKDLILLCAVGNENNYLRAIYDGTHYGACIYCILLLIKQQLTLKNYTYDIKSGNIKDSLGNEYNLRTLEHEIGGKALGTRYMRELHRCAECVRCLGDDFLPSEKMQLEILQQEDVTDLNLFLVYFLYKYRIVSEKGLDRYQYEQLSRYYDDSEIVNQNESELTDLQKKRNLLNSADCFEVDKLRADLNKDIKRACSYLEKTDVCELERIETAKRLFESSEYEYTFVQAISRINIYSNKDFILPYSLYLACTKKGMFKNARTASEEMYRKEFKGNWEKAREILYNNKVQEIKALNEKRIEEGKDPLAIHNTVKIYDVNIIDEYNNCFKDQGSFLTQNKITKYLKGTSQVPGEINRNLENWIERYTNEDANKLEDYSNLGEYASEIRSRIFELKEYVDTKYEKQNLILLEYALKISEALDSRNVREVKILYHNYSSILQKLYAENKANTLANNNRDLLHKRGGNRTSREDAYNENSGSHFLNSKFTITNSNYVEQKFKVPVGFSNTHNTDGEKSTVSYEKAVTWKFNNIARLIDESIHVCNDYKIR